MKHTNALIVKVAALALAGGMYGTASAKIIDDYSLGAADFVKEFNKFGGITFTLQEFPAATYPAWKVLVPQEGSPYRVQSMIFDHPRKDVFDWDGAYRYGDGFTTTNPLSKQYENLFVTVQMAPTITLPPCGVSGLCTATAKLNYNEITGTTQTDYSPAGNSTLTVGAAYMYVQYVFGADYGNPVSWANSQAFAELTYADGNPNRGKWFSSMDFLLDVNNDKDYWLAAYDPDKLYTEIGGYSVFVMNMYNPDKSSMGNLLFVAKTIPEPETYAMMLAGLGLVGAVVRRRRSMGRS
ncbi:MAG: PEPxxWA-CTERM sorting domain-containing protein [Treponema sp.]|nr:PEPxxWA-CTERM sorting domain-containing protein [Treponema sp.]